jgi:solute carrier family 25 citrate transporter 1
MGGCASERLLRKDHPSHMYIFMLPFTHSTFPTEYVKTTQQLSSKSMSVKEVISGTMAESGVLGFYRGLSSMLYFAAPKAAIRFSAFEFFSGCLTDANGGDKYGLGQAKGFLAGLGAGTMEAIFVTTPQETIKIKLIHDQVSSYLG